MQSGEADVEFIRHDWSIYISNLPQRAGVPINYIRALVLKELTDNALDEMDRVGRPGEVTLTYDDEHTYTVTDRGRGFPDSPEELAHRFSIAKGMVSSKQWRRPIKWRRLAMSWSIFLNRPITTTARSTPCFASLTHSGKRQACLDAPPNSKPCLSPTNHSTPGAPERSMLKINNPPGTCTEPVRFGLLDIHVTLQLRDEPNNATGVARSALSDGRRFIRVSLFQTHLMGNRALQRADTLTIRFLVGLALSEFCAFWGRARDGAAVIRALKKLAGFEPHENAWGSGFASRLAICEPMRIVDSLPIFSRSPQSGPFDLFVVTAEGRSPSDIKNWQVRDDETEALKPIPKPPPRPKPEPGVVASPPDPFFAAFHETARSALDEATFQTLEDLTRGAANA